MLKNKNYFKIAGAAAFAVVLLCGVSYAHNKYVIPNRNTVEQTDKTVNSLQADKMTAASTVEKNSNISKPKDPTIIDYIVKASDTIESIANTYGIKVSTITASNNISENTVLKEGEKLTFPSIDGVVYKVKGGETLWDLSSLYKINQNEIISVNKLEDPNKLKLGQSIIIPNADKLLAFETKTTSSSSTSTSSKKASTVKSNGTSKTMVAINRGARPTNGYISSNFGERWGKDHNGVDIAASTGTDVFAYNSGTVTFSGWQNGYGNLVIINHGNGLQTYYGHNSKLLVKVGQKVTKGQHISEVGSTGHSTGPHLHFEVRKNGIPVNPMPYLS